MTALLRSTVDPAWLPVGSRAEVVLSTDGASAPEPLGLVRLLITSDDAVLAVPRRHGAGLDIPTAAVHGPAPGMLDRLVAQTLRAPESIRLLGWVHNHVPEAGATYEWPAPDAYFGVWHCASERGRERTGQWLSSTDAAARLGARHWWPLAQSLLD